MKLHQILLKIVSELFIKLFSIILQLTFIFFFNFSANLLGVVVPVEEKPADESVYEFQVKFFISTQPHNIQSVKCQR